jgi:hypothetical protein
MKKEEPCFRAVRDVGLVFPEAEESRYYGLPALKIHGQMFVVQAGHRSAEPGSISVAVGFQNRERLIASNPNVFYLKPHYKPYPVVLVRLRRIKRAALRQLLRSAYHSVLTGAVKPVRVRGAHKLGRQGR